MITDVIMSKGFLFGACDRLNLVCSASFSLVL